MKELFTSAIKRGGYDLTEMLKKIDTYHVEGKLSDTERDTLYEMARGNKANQYDYSKEIEELWKTVRELKTRVETLENSNNADSSVDTETETEEAEQTYAEYVQPTGAHDAYMSGDRVNYNGVNYICTMDYCVYSPDVYPSAWEIII